MSAPTPSPNPPPLSSGQLFHLAAERPAASPRIDEIRLEGLHRTRPSTVLAIVDRLRDATSLVELRQAALSAEARLQRLGVFRGMRITFDEGPAADAASTTAVVSVTELDALLGYRLQTFVTAQGRTGAEAAVKYRNLTGRADTIELIAQRDAQKDWEAALLYSHPTLLPKDGVARFRLFQATENQQSTSSYTTTQRGFAASARSLSGTHELEYSFSWRELYDPSCTASRAVMAHKGHALKSAVRHTWRAFWEGEDGSWEASVRASTEIAGLVSGAMQGATSSTSTARTPSESGMVRQIREHLVARATIPLGSKGVAVHLGGEVGIVLPLGGGGAGAPDASTAPPISPETLLCERFFPGGVPSLRGFARHGVGPAAPRRATRMDSDASSSSSSSSPSLGSTHDALGLDLLLGAHASLSFPLYSTGLRGHVFADGATGALHLGQGREGGLAGWRRELGEAFRASVGIGLLLPTALGNLEVNAVHVVRKQDLDHLSGRVQFGLTAGDM